MLERKNSNFGLHSAILLVPAVCAKKRIVAKFVLEVTKSGCKDFYEVLRANVQYVGSRYRGLQRVQHRCQLRPPSAIFQSNDANIPFLVCSMHKAMPGALQ